MINLGTNFLIPKYYIDIGLPNFELCETVFEYQTLEKLGGPKISCDYDVEHSKYFYVNLANPATILIGENLLFKINSETFRLTGCSDFIENFMLTQILAP